VEIQDTKAEIETVGKDSTPLAVDKWFVGKTSMDEGKATVLVFWEVWCPHCQREVPKLQATYDKYKGSGLNMVGVTQVSNGKTDEEVASFLSEAKVTYPIAKTGPDVPGHYNVSGIPAAAVVKDGKVVWRGHPAMLTDSLIEGWLGS
jgi:thiol-disulfide isomerase/thioredoxin